MQLVLMAEITDVYLRLCLTCTIGCRYLVSCLNRYPLSLLLHLIVMTMIAYAEVSIRWRCLKGVATNVNQVLMDSSR